MTTRSELVDSIEYQDPPRNLDRITDLARRLADTSTSLITILDDDYQSFLAQSGSEFETIDRDQSICQFALENEEGEELKIPNLSEDSRTRDLPYEEQYGSYLGLPIVVDETVIGTLCVLDESPKTFSGQTIHDLDTLAREVAERLKKQRTRRKLERTNFIFDEMAQGIEDVFWMVDRQFKSLTYLNDDSFNSMFPDLRADDLEDDPMKFLRDVKQEHQQNLLQMRETLIAGKPAETIVQLTDDTWVKYYAFPVEQSGEITHIAGITSDITDIRDLREDIKEQKQRFQELTTHIDEVFWVTGHNTEEFEYVSRAFSDIWGFETRELYRNPERWVNSIHPDDRPDVEPYFSSSNTDGYNLEYRIVRPDDEVRWIHDKAFPIHDESGQLERIVGIAEDVTERVRDRKKLSEARKLANIGEMSAMIMHEINNPNSYIQGNLDYLKKLLDKLRSHVKAGETDALKGMLGDDLNELIQSLREGTRRIDKITEDVKQFAREATKRKKHKTGFIDVNAITDKLADIRERQSDDVEYHCSIDSDPSSSLPLSETEFESLLNNLIDNALDATDPSDRTVDVHLNSSDDELYLMVRDNGKGMTEDVQERLFEPFESTKTSKSGTGLGMAIVESIVSRMDGIISVESEPGSGTVFEIEIPLVANRS